MQLWDRTQHISLFKHQSRDQTCFGRLFRRPCWWRAANRLAGRYNRYGLLAFPKDCPITGHKGLSYHIEQSYSNKPDCFNATKLVKKLRKTFCKGNIQIAWKFTLDLGKCSLKKVLSLGCTSRDLIRCSRDSLTFQKIRLFTFLLRVRSDKWYHSHGAAAGSQSAQVKTGSIGGNSQPGPVQR